jgi:hypothetical protein
MSRRDSMLALTSRIDLTGGPPGDGGSYRRSVYTSVIRNRLDPLLSAFDFPVPSSTRGRRNSTNVPAQALALLNDPSVEKWAGNWSARVLSNKDCNDDTARARRMFEEAFGRPAADREVSQSLAYVRLLRAEGVGAADAWRSFAQSLFNSKEFLYLR